MISSCFKKALILLAIVTWSANGAFPDNPKPCKYGDSQCIGKIIEYIAKEKHEGDESLALTATDPLPVKRLHIKQGADSPVNIDLLFTNNVLYGLKTARLVEMKGFGKNLATKHKIVAKGAEFHMVGDYTVSGKVLILPIRGKGKSNITMVEPTFTFSWTGIPYEKNGETYMKIDKYTVDIDPKKMYFNFENLFNDKALSDNMNKFLTENWSDVYPEIRAHLGHGFSLVTRTLLENVFAKYPYNKLFTD